MRWTVPATLVAALTLACGDAPPAETADSSDTVRATPETATVVPPVCSAASLDPTLPAQPDLPDPVAATRAAIARAAVACDWAALDSLAGAPGFSYSFGDGIGPAAYWREAEAAGQKPLWMLVRTLSLPWITEVYEEELGTYYIWPSVFADQPTEEDWATLEGVYPPDEIEAYREIGFIGWRAGIAGNGEWRFFIAGD